MPRFSKRITVTSSHLCGYVFQVINFPDNASSESSASEDYELYMILPVVKKNYINKAQKATTAQCEKLILRMIFEVVFVLAIAGPAFGTLAPTQPIDPSCLKDGECRYGNNLAVETDGRYCQNSMA